MAEHGKMLSAYLKDKKTNMSALAKSLEMSRQNLYQLFDSKEFEEETILNMEKVLKIKFSDLENYRPVNIDKLTPKNKKPGTNKLNVGEQPLNTDFSKIVSMLEESHRVIIKNVDTILNHSATIRSQEEQLNRFTKKVLKKPDKLEQPKNAFTPLKISKPVK